MGDDAETFTTGDLVALLADAGHMLTDVGALGRTRAVGIDDVPIPLLSDEVHLDRATGSVGGR